MNAGKAGPVTGLMEKLLAYPNIPRKKNKFFNFVNNSLFIRGSADVERLWSVIVEANQKDEQQVGKDEVPPAGSKRQIAEDQHPVEDKKRMKKSST